MKTLDYWESLSKAKKTFPESTFVTEEFDDGKRLAVSVSTGEVRHAWELTKWKPNQAVTEFPKAIKEWLVQFS